MFKKVFKDVQEFLFDSTTNAASFSFKALREKYPEARNLTEEELEAGFLELEGVNAVVSLSEISDALMYNSNSKDQGLTLLIDDNYYEEAKN